MRAVNLIPAEQREGTAIGAGRSEGAAYAVLALIGGLALLVLLYGMASHQVAKRQAQVQSLNTKAQRAQAAVAQLAPYMSFSALREQRMQAVSELVDSRFDWAHAFHELGRVLPRGVWITSLTGMVGSTTGTGATTGAGSTTTPAPAASSASAGAAGSSASSAVTSATPPGSVPNVTLTGCGSSQAAVALTLNRLRLMDGVGEVTLQSSTASSTSGGGASTSSGGACPAADPAFTIQVAFDPLPAASSSPQSTTQTAADGGVG